LPITFIPEEYGKIIQKFDNQYIIFHEKAIIILTQVIKSKERYNLIKYFKNNVLLYSWKDVYVNDKTFIREIGKTLYYYENNKLLLRKTTKPVKFMEKIKENTRNK
jgi:hypothetical protein